MIRTSLVKERENQKCLVYLFSILLLCIPFNTTQAKTSIRIISQDQPGEGLNDQTPKEPVGGNTGTTLGEQRTIALEYAAHLIGQFLHSDLEIEIKADFRNEGGSTYSATLATAGPNSVHYNFSGAPQFNTYYPQALANKLNHHDLSSSSDINAVFNSDVDTPSVLGDDSWYYGLDAKPPYGDVDFVTVALHELLHGLGFLSLVNAGTGTKFNSRNDSYSHYLKQVGVSPSAFNEMTNSGRTIAATAIDKLVWNGETANFLAAQQLSKGLTSNQVQVYAPNPVEDGSSISHFSTKVSPNELMEPNYTGAKHYLGLAGAILSEVGWGNYTDLNVTLTSNSSYSNLNEAASFNIIAHNAGSQTADDVEVEYPIPNNAQVETAIPDQGHCDIASSVVTCQLGSILSTQQVSVAITYTALEAGETTHAASISGDIVEQDITNNDDTLSISVLAGGVAGTPPVANAGSDHIIPAATAVSISGAASIGSTSPIAAFQWQQLSGPQVQLSGSNSSEISFTSPSLSNTTLTFSLTVTDEQGLESSDSVTLTTNYAPTAVAGSDIQVEPGDSFTLNGSGSYDPDSTTLQFSWTQQSGEQSIALSQASNANLSIQAPAYDDIIQMELRVIDENGLADTDTVTITIGTGVAAITSSADSRSGGGGGAMDYVGLFVLIIPFIAYRKRTSYKQSIGMRPC